MSDSTAIIDGSQGPTTLLPGIGWMSYEQAELYTGLSRVTLWRATNRGELHPAKVGRSVRFRREDLDAWLLGQTEQS